MKTNKRLIAMLMAVIMVLGIVLPIHAETLDFVISIETAEDFLAMMEHPNGSYRLERSIDLGMIEPLGYNRENGSITAFSGSLDGNNCTVSYQMKEVPGCSKYGLFAELKGAEISSLNVSGQMDLILTEEHYCNVGILVGYLDGTIGGGSVKGNLNVKSTGGGAIVGGVVGAAASRYYSGERRIVETKVDVNTTIHAEGTEYCSYNGIGNSTEAINCFVDGSARLEGNITYVKVVSDGNKCEVSQNVTVRANGKSEVTAIQDGTENSYSGTIQVTADGTSGNSKITGISGGTMNIFEGAINAVGNNKISTTLIMAKSCLGAKVEGNGILNGSGYVYGLEYCDSSSMNGNLTVKGGNKVYGLYDCDDAIFNGDITYNNSYARSRIYGAYKGNRNQVNGSLSITSTDENAGVYGIIECNHSSFTGSLYAKGPSTAHAVGACNAKYNVVSASIVVDSGERGEATGVSSPHSSFEGSISCPGGSVRGCGDDSVAKGSLRGQTVTATGGSSYFNGSIEAVYSKGDIKAHVGIGCAADASVVVRGGKNGASFYPGVYYSGNASISAEDGNIHAEAFDNSNVSISHKASGVSGSVQSILAKADREESADVYWHRYAKQEKCTKDSHEYFEYGYHSYYKPCFQTVASVLLQKANYKSPAEFGWKGSIDPVNLSYKPEIEPVDYILKVTDSSGEVFENCRVSIGGEYRYPDTDGSIVVENGSAVISPLHVELKGASGIYTKVLTRTAYYPVPNMINIIRLEPNVNDLELLLIEEGCSGVEGGQTWGGIPVKMGGSTVDLIKNPMDIEIMGESGFFKYRNERVNNGNIGYTISAGWSGGEEDWEFVENSSEFIEKKLEQMAGLIKTNKDWGKRLGKLSGIDINAGAVGYAEFAFDKDTSKWKPVDGNLGVAVSGGKRITYHFPQAAYLVYLTGAYNLEGSGKVGLKKVAMDDSIEHTKAKLYGTIGITGETELAIGAGNRYFETFAEGGGKGQLGGNWTLSHKSARESLSLDLTLNAFFRWRLFGFAEQTFESKGLTFPLWPREQASAMLAMNEDAQYTVLSRDYLQNSAKNRSIQDSETISIYPYAQSQLLTLADDRYVLVYTDDNINRADADRSALRIRIGTEVDGDIIWNDAVTIEEDGTADYGFTACASGNEVAVIWQDMTKTYGDGLDVNMDEVAASVELTQAIVDCSNEVAEVERIASVNTGTDVCERMPMIYYDGEDHLRSTWVTCSDNNPAEVTEDSTYSIWLSEGLGEQGTLVADNLPAISGMALLPDDFLWSTYAGDGSDLWLLNESGEVSCQEESGIYNLQSVNSRFIYTKGDARYGGVGNYNTCRQEGYGEVNQNVLRLSALGDVHYAISGLDSSTVYLVDGEVGRPIGNYDGYLSSYDMAGSQIVTVLRTGFEDADTAKMDSQSKQIIEDIDIEVVCDNPTAAPGSYVEIAVGILNNGTYKVEEIPISIVAEDGSILYEQSHDLNLETGEGAIVDLSVPVPSEFVPQNVTVNVGNESFTLHLGNSNLSLHAEWNRVNAGGISVMVENTGHGEAAGIVKATDEDGKLLASADVSLPQGYSDIIWMDFGKCFDKETKVTVTLQEYDEQAFLDDNQVVISVSPIKSDSNSVENEIWIQKGTTKMITVQNLPAGAELSGCKYRSTDTKIAIVTSDGKVRGIAAGDAAVIVTDQNGAEYEVIIHVYNDSGNPDVKPENPFADIFEKDYYYDSVLWAYNNNITAGIDAVHFNPGGFCTRSQAVTFLWRVAGMPKSENIKKSFQDVPNGMYYTDAVTWAVNEGITAGYSEHVFAPEDTCTRAQIVTFLWRYMGCPDPQSMECSFKDVGKDAYYYKAVLWAVEQGITAGYSSEIFAPSDTCTRAQIVTFLYRFLK